MSFANSEGEIAWPERWLASAAFGLARGLVCVFSSAHAQPSGTPRAPTATSTATDLAPRMAFFLTINSGSTPM